MNRCEKCKYYKETEHECLSDKFIYGGGGVYGSGKIIDPEAPENDCLYYFDYEGYSAHFVVGPKFGCVHFKKMNIMSGGIKWPST